MGQVKNDWAKAKYTSKRNENIYPPISLYTTGYSNMIRTSQKVETTQIHLNWEMDKHKGISVQ